MSFATTDQPSDYPRSRRVIFLTQSYFPNAFIASHRAAKLAKYLPQYGWAPLVVCTEATRNNCVMYDPALLTDEVKKTILAAIPDRERYESRAKQRLSDIVYFFRHPDALYYAVTSRLIESHVHRKPPTYYVGALAFLRFYLRTTRPNCIFATTPAPATLALADKMSQEFGIPWVADFRDTFDIKMQAKSERVRHRFLRQEPRVVASSAAIVTVSQALREALEARHQRPVQVLPNGFDPEDYATVAPRSSGKFSIVYTGSIYYPDQNPKPLFSALTRLIKNGTIPGNAVSLEFYGRSSAVLNHLLSAFPGIASVVSVHPPISHKESISQQKGATILLHFAHGEEKGILTGKLFEYLAAGRPILCNPGDQDAVDEVLQRTRAGISCRTQDALEKQLAAWFLEWQQTGTVAYCGATTEINKYSRKAQAGELASLFDEILAESAN